MTDLLALAERVEALTGPSREVDALIRCALFAPATAYVEQSPLNGAWIVYDGTEVRSGRPRIFERWPSQEVRLGEFTASLDAAMTLADGLSEAAIWTIWNDALTACSCAEADIRKDVARYWAAAALRASAGAKQSPTPTKDHP